jgi:hypothetical protein
VRRVAELGSLGGIHVSTNEQFPTDLSNALAEYVDTLARGTTYANDRPLFEHHLARAAEMFSAIHRRDAAYLRQLVDSEIHYFGHTYIRTGG